MESRTDVPEARQWLNHLKDHLLEIEDSHYAQDHERLREKLNLHGNRPRQVPGHAGRLVCQSRAGKFLIRVRNTGRQTMRIDYDPEHDTVSIRLHETPRTADSDEIEPGVIVDYGPDGQVLGFELLDAQRRGPWAEWIQWIDKLQERAART